MADLLERIGDALERREDAFRAGLSAAPFDKPDDWGRSGAGDAIGLDDATGYEGDRVT